VRNSPMTDKKIPSFTGLYKRPNKSEPKKFSYILKARQRGTNKVVSVTLGTSNALNLSEAKVLAKENLQLLQQGINPNEQRKQELANKEQQKTLQEQAELTLGQAYDERLLELSHNSSPATISSYKNVFKNHCSHLKNKPLKEITERDMTTLYAKVRKTASQSGRVFSSATNEAGEAQAQKLLRYLSATFNYYLGDEINGVPLLTKNPVNVIKRKKLRPTIKRRERNLEPEQLGLLLYRASIISIFGLDKNTNNIRKDEADFMLVLALNGQRLNELSSVLWKDVQLDTEIPSYTLHDTKNKTSHQLPMTDAVLNAFINRHNDKHSESPYVFYSRRRPEVAMSVDKLANKFSKEIEFEFTAHDLRRTFAYASNYVDVSHYDRKALLNHSTQDVTDGYIGGLSLQDKLIALTKINDYMLKDEEKHLKDGGFKTTEEYKELEDKVISFPLH
jgi:integrase